MLSNLSSTNIINTKYNDIEIYKDTVKTMLKLKKNINQLKKINNYSENDLSIEDNIMILKNQKKINHLENSFAESLILLSIIKKELEKNILKKYNIENIAREIIEEENHTKQKIDTIEKTHKNIDSYMNIISKNYYKQILQEDDQKVIMKKKF
ncbi:hypothetical protein [Buchnera aphidicola]|uniref:Flagellar FliJ protein n=1 Tax=Buchnera aphidicola subsp. Uroleucon sonchi TaxID=118118 RepID=A0A6C1FIM4_BUCUN|nr:hypothetical protein [Buchnera aphidicola]QIE02249.1 hypothetical protein GUU85_02765 [Buchnera aphidicola (Uroleucon sonchi)]